MTHSGFIQVKRILAFAAALAASLLFLHTAPSQSLAAPPLNGWGYGIADSSGPPFANPWAEKYVKQLQPKIFRVQLPYDIVPKSQSDPGANDWKKRIKASIIRMRQLGVRDVLVTFSMRYEDMVPVPKKYPHAHRPSVPEYASAVSQAVAEFDSLVDAWSPANEPNAGWTWFGNAHSSGPALVAGYYNALKGMLPPGDELVSPEFHDTVDTDNGSLRHDNLHANDSRSELTHWIDHYQDAMIPYNDPQGGWGDHAAIHPYGAVQRGLWNSVNDFKANAQLPAGVDVWLPEIGGVYRCAACRSSFTQLSQAWKVQTLVNNAKTDPLVSRVYYYNVHDDLNPGWGSALVGNSGNSPTLAWNPWCAAARYGVPGGCSIHDTPVPGNYDSDPQADVAVWRPSSATWFFKDSGSGIAWGTPEDVPIPANWDSDPQTDLALFRPSTVEWIFRDTPGANVAWGVYGDIPVPGNYDSDPEWERALWRPSEGKWYFQDGSSVVWGQVGDIPVPANYDSDPQTDIAVFRPSDGIWHFYDTQSSVQWGQDGDVPVPGNYDSDPQAEIALWRPSDGIWHTYDPANALQFGQIGDVPVPADYDGNGTTDRAIWRPFDGIWHFAGGAPSVQWGQ